MTKGVCAQTPHQITRINQRHDQHTRVRVGVVDHVGFTIGEQRRIEPVHLSSGNTVMNFFMRMISGMTSFRNPFSRAFATQNSRLQAERRILRHNKRLLNINAPNPSEMSKGDILQNTKILDTLMDIKIDSDQMAADERLSDEILAKLVRSEDFMDSVKVYAGRDGQNFKFEVTAWDTKKSNWIISEDSVDKAIRFINEGAPARSDPDAVLAAYALETPLREMAEVIGDMHYITAIKHPIFADDANKGFTETRSTLAR